MAKSVYLCVIRNEMIVYKAFLGRSGTSDSIRSLLGSGELVPIDSWSEVGLTYEKYDTDAFKRVWNKILKEQGGLEKLDKIPTDGTLGILYEY